LLRKLNTDGYYVSQGLKGRDHFIDLGIDERIILRK
jgi:hypothetical protein